MPPAVPGTRRRLPARGALAGVGVALLLGPLLLVPPTGGAAAAEPERAASVCADSSPIRARELAAVRSARAACDLTGRTITTADGLAVPVPAVGESVTASAVRADGPPIRLTVTNADGAVTASRRGETVRPEALTRAERKRPACRDARYAFGGSTWKTAFNWRFHGRTTPHRFARGDVQRTLYAAAANVARARDDCGLKGRPAVHQVYRGSATQAPDIDSSGRCTAKDPVSSIGFGRLGEGQLAVTCLWATGGRSYVADVRIAPRGDLVLGVRGKCQRKYDLQSFMTHEFGTILGLANVESRTLTMGAYVQPCTDRLRTLGRGDVLGITKLYGRR